MSESTDSEIGEFCEKMNIKPSDLAKACGIESQYIYNMKNRRKQPHVVRHNAETGSVELIRTERIMCHGNLNRSRW